MVRAYVSIVAVEALSHLEDAGILTELRPEVLGDLWDGINTDAIEVVGLNKILNPVFQLLSHPLVALVEVRKASESAVLNLPLVVPVVDIAVSVIVLSSVERVDLTVVVFNWCHVIANDVHHDPNAHLMSGIHQVLKCLLPTEVIVNLLPVASPISVIAIVQVIDDGRYPNGIES